ncbi:MAG: DUF47 domain-containing protein [Actinobacteria bacterium]|nr:DUF47 domain-containing protein [Actinomycetota bacterium]
MRLSLTPRDAVFFDLLADAAANLVEGADLLHRLAGAEPTDRPELAALLRDAEHRGDEITHTTMRRLNSTFVTPFDREDIYALASAVDDCIDHIEEAGSLIVLYRPRLLPRAVLEQAEVLQAQARSTAEALPRLRTMTDLDTFWTEINRLENVADDVHRRFLGELFANGTDAIEVLKIKEIVDALESAADAFEKVANHVETIAVKES